MVCCLTVGPTPVPADPPESERFCDADATEPYLVLPKPSGGRLNFSVGWLLRASLIPHRLDCRCATPFLLVQERTIGATSTQPIWCLFFLRVDAHPSAHVDGLAVFRFQSFFSPAAGNAHRWSKALFYPYNLTQLLMSFGASCLTNGRF
jgi:hypothetical protein